MLRTAFAIGIAGLIFVGGSESSQAAPILPLPAASTVGLNNLTDVQWGRNCWRDRWGRVRCRGGGWGPGWGGGPGWGRDCWRDRWGHVRCRW
jgi:hypothetical protein